MDDRLGVQLLRREQREAGGEVESHLVAEHRERAGTGTVILAPAAVAHMTHEVEIRTHREGSAAEKAEAIVAEGSAAIIDLTISWPGLQLHNHRTSHVGMKKAYARTIPAAWRRTARIFVALGDAHRQRILLMFERGERLNVGQIVAASTLSRSAVSHHLRVLREAGVLDSEKLGKEVYFWPNADAVRAALDTVRDYLTLNF
jgi:DNA-binding transcriptional ArsR family regulator